MTKPNTPYLTVAQLREAIATLPDDMIVTLHDPTVHHPFGVAPVLLSTGNVREWVLIPDPSGQYSTTVLVMSKVFMRRNPLVKNIVVWKVVDGDKEKAGE